jgi:predicted nucleic acid-binding protein
MGEGSGVRKVVSCGLERILESCGFRADLLVASMASEHGLAVVTRNTKDFEGCGTALLNPFSALGI